MKRIIPLLLILVHFIQPGFSQSMGIGTTTPDNSAILDIQSTSKGVLVPRLSSVQRAAIPSPASGLLVFDATTESFWFKSATNWIELVDTSNNLWKKNGTHIYTTGNTQVGIGISAPAFDLHIKQSNASMGLTDATTNKVSGTFTGSDGELVINSYRSSGTGGDIILQRSNSLPTLNAGNVGIGIPFTSAPTAKLQVQGGAILSISADSITGGMFQLGVTNAANLAMDNNEIQARNNGAIADITLQKRGGHIIIDESTKLKRNNADMLPLAYGVVSSSGGIISGTGNFIVVRVSMGHYRIFVNGSQITEANSTVLITPFNVSGQRYGNISYYALANSSVDVNLSPDNSGNTDGKFAFIIYRF